MIAKYIAMFLLLYKKPTTKDGGPGYVMTFKKRISIEPFIDGTEALFIGVTKICNTINQGNQRNGIL